MKVHVSQIGVGEALFYEQEFNAVFSRPDVHIHRIIGGCVEGLDREGKLQRGMVIAVFYTTKKPRQKRRSRK